MPIRNQSTLQIDDILLRDKIAGNPFATGADGGICENFYIDQGKLVRTSFSPPFHTSTTTDSVWDIKEFNFTRDNAAEQQLLIFKSSGKVYRRRGGEEVQVYPENDTPSNTAASDADYAGTGGTTAGSNTDWSNTSNIAGGSNATYATSANPSASSGPLYTTTVAVVGPGVPAWNNPGNATADDSALTSVFLHPEVTSDYLECTGFGFSIPSNATIAGILVEVKNASTNGFTIDTEALLISNGSSHGNNAAHGTGLPTTVPLTYTQYGSSTDLWGYPWSVAEINDSTFGFSCRFKDPNIYYDDDVFIDTVRITVYYYIASTDQLNATNYGLAVVGIIAGIIVRVTGKVVLVSGSADSTMSVQLIQGGSPVGNAQVQDFNSTSDVTLSFGGSANLWGASWTAADINASTFGVSIVCTKDGTPSGIVTFSIDSVYVSVVVNNSGTMQEKLFTSKPAIAQIANRLHVSDGRIYRIYDGWHWVTAGLDAPTDFDNSDTSLTGTGLSGTYRVAISAVHIRNSNGVDIRIHESNRSALASESPSNQSIRVSIASVTMPARATHWSVYMETPAESGVLRRVSTLPISTTTYDISAEPSSTAPLAPERNDPAQPSHIIAQWKNRVAWRSESNPDLFGFSAFGEVNGLLNGAGDECQPGRLGSNSLSDVVNEWQIPDGGQPMQCAVYHGEVLWIFTDRHGFYIQGEGALLDDQELRDFRPQKGLDFGAAGPNAALSTPQGLAVMSHEHKLWLWKSGPEAIDIGHDIQNRLDDLTEEQLNNIGMVYWSGEGWDWLMLPLADRIAVFDFSLGTEKSPVGGWFSLTFDSVPTCISIYHPGHKFLLSGHADGSVRQLATICQPAHLDLSAKLGETYLGSAVQNSPIARIRTGPLTNEKGQWTEFKYIQYYHLGHTDTTNISTSDPIIKAYYDQTNPTTPDNGITLTSATVSGSNERRAYFAPSSTASAVGALAKSVNIEMGWTSTDTDSATRPQLVNNEILRIAITSQPRSERTR